MRFILYSFCMSFVGGSSQRAWNLVVSTETGYINYVRREQDSSPSIDKIPSQLDWTLPDQRKRKLDGFSIVEDQDSDGDSTMELQDGDGSLILSEVVFENPLLKESLQESVKPFDGDTQQYDNLNKQNLGDNYSRTIEWLMTDVRVICFMERKVVWPTNGAAEFLFYNTDYDTYSSVLTVYLFEDREEPIAIYPSDSSMVNRGQRFVKRTKESLVREAILSRNINALTWALKVSWARSQWAPTQHILTVEEVFGEEHVLDYEFKFEHVDCSRIYPTTVYTEFADALNNVVAQIGIYIPLNRDEQIVLYPLEGYLLESSVLYNLLGRFSEMRISKHALAPDAPYMSEIGDHIALMLNAEWEINYREYTNL